MSPWLPIKLRKTEASVPLPLTIPVQTVTLYLITAAQKESLCIFVFGTNTVVAYEVKLGVNTYGAAARERALRRREAPSQPRYHPHSCPASAHRESCTSPSSESSSEWPILQTGKMESALLTIIMHNHEMVNTAHPAEVPPCKRTPLLMPQTDLGQLSKIRQLDLWGHIMLKDSQ